METKTTTTDDPKQQQQQQQQQWADPPEHTAVLIERVKEIISGAPILVDIPDHVTEAYDIAKLEWAAGKLGHLLVVRPSGKRDAPPRLLRASELRAMEL